MSHRKGALFQIRPATIAHAPLLARHRAAMFTDMGRLVADWESASVEGAVLTAMTDRKVHRIVLHASDDGRRLYQRLGFVPTNEMHLE